MDKKEIAYPALELLADIEHKLPDAWPWIARARAGDIDEDLGWGNVVEGMWPSWCYIPFNLLGCWMSANHMSEARRNGISNLTVIAAWRQTKGCYAFDPDLSDELMRTPHIGDLPADALFRLPEWCVYIRPTNVDPFFPLGFFAQLDMDYTIDHTTLRVTYYDRSNHMWSTIPFVVGHHTIRQGIEIYAARMEQRWNETGSSMPNANRRIHARYQKEADVLEHAMTYVLYLCVDEIDAQLPLHPSTYKRGGKAAPAPVIWDIGTRIGAKLRFARDHNPQVPRPTDGEDDASATHASPRAHIRRGHYHAYWIGKKDDPKTLKLHYVLPIPVNMKFDDGKPRPAVIRPVEAKPNDDASSPLSHGP